MTLVSHQLIELSDIKALRLICQSCKVSVNYPLAEIKHVELVCPNCNETWFERGSNDKQFLEVMINSIASLAARTKDAKALIQLELPAAH